MSIHSGSPATVSEVSKKEFLNHTALTDTVTRYHNHTQGYPTTLSYRQVGMRYAPMRGGAR